MRGRLNNPLPPAPEADPAVESLEQQLQALYAERERLVDELGVADADEIIGMVRNLEHQLSDLYATHGHRDTADGDGTLALLSYVQELSKHLDEMYSERSVTFHLDGDKPVVRAEWRETQK